MSTPSPTLPQPCAEDARRCLSALADGQSDAADPAFQHWRDDADARQTWHAYHLIGDVLRSEELARPPARDAAFLAGLRARLAAEPVVLAPLPAVSRRHPNWLLPAAAAAGFVVVAGVMVVIRLASPGGQGEVATMAAASAGAALTLAGATADGNGAPRGRDERLIRDARLDEFLRAHQSARGGVALSGRASTLRQVDVVVPVDAAR